MPVQEYEITFVVNPTLSEEDTVGVAERVTQTVVTRGGNVTDITPWGKRRLAYPIDHLREGSYITIGFTMESERAAELEPVINLMEPVIRHVVVRLDDRQKARAQRARVAAQRAAAQQQAAASAAATAQDAAAQDAAATAQEPAAQEPAAQEVAAPPAAHDGAEDDLAGEDVPLAVPDSADDEEV
jgi:small subunit ribosomal protein S6